jgi:nucleotide-binding universal stress UspA family protein
MSIDPASLARERRPILLVPYDFTKPSALALARAQEIAGKSGGSVVLLHVVRPTAGAGGVGNPVLVEASRRVVETAASLEGSLGELAAKLEVPARTSVELGDPATAICARAREIGASLIVMGTRGGGRGLRGVFRSSTTARTVLRAPCPVLTLHGEEAA